MVNDVSDGGRETETAIGCEDPAGAEQVTGFGTARPLVKLAKVTGMLIVFAGPAIDMVPVVIPIFAFSTDSFCTDTVSVAGVVVLLGLTPNQLGNKSGVVVKAAIEAGPPRLRTLRIVGAGGVG